MFGSRLKQRSRAIRFWCYPLHLCFLLSVFLRFRRFYCVPWLLLQLRLPRIIKCCVYWNTNSDRKSIWHHTVKSALFANTWNYSRMDRRMNFSPVCTSTNTNLMLGTSFRSRLRAATVENAKFGPVPPQQSCAQKQRTMHHFIPLSLTTTRSPIRLCHGRTSYPRHCRRTEI